MRRTLAGYFATRLSSPPPVYGKSYTEKLYAIFGLVYSDKNLKRENTFREEDHPRDADGKFAEKDKPRNPNHMAKIVLTRFDITTKNNVMMDCGFDGVIGFKKNVFNTKANAIQGSRNSQTVAGRLKNAKDRMEGVGVHETGHLLELALIRKNPEYKDDNQRETAWKHSTEAKSIIDEAYRRAIKEKAGQGKSRDTLILEISDYAEENDSECLAEAITDCHYNAGQARLLSRMIYKVVQERLGG